MNPRARNYGILGAIWVLVLALVFVSHGAEENLPFLLLLLPLITAAGYLEETTGALVVTLASAVAVVVARRLGWVAPLVAVAEILAFGLMFCFMALLVQDRETGLRRDANEREPREKERQKLEFQTQVLRGQIETSERQLKGLVKLYEVVKKLSSIIELAPLMDEARTVVAKILNHHFGSSSAEEAGLAFYLADEKNPEDYLKTSARGHEVSDEGFPDRLRSAEVKQWLGDGYSALRIKDLAQDPRFRGWAEHTPFRSLLAVPLVAHDTVIGLMNLAARPANAFSNLDFSQAEVLGKQIVFALRKALLYRRVQMLSFTDSQTGLYVHRYFLDRLGEEIHRSERYHQFLSLIMLDMDHFKQVNDQYGHPMGDAVLVEAAARIQQMVSSAALVARYGGEEFAVLLPNTPKSKALPVAHAINAFLKAAPIEVGGVRLTVTISAGVSTYPEDALDRESLINTADSALYEAKRNGRDLVRVFSEVPPKKS